MNYREIVGMAPYQEWAAKYKTVLDERNVSILAQRQARLDTRTGIGIGDFVMDGKKALRVAHHWGDSIQLTSGEFGGSFYLGDTHVEFSGGLDSAIPIERFKSTDERRGGPVWFFSQNSARAHNGYETTAVFRVWRLEPALELVEA